MAYRDWSYAISAGASSVLNSLFTLSHADDLGFVQRRLQDRLTAPPPDLSYRNLEFSPIDENTDPMGSGHFFIFGHPLSIKFEGGSLAPYSDSVMRVVATVDALTSMVTDPNAYLNVKLDGDDVTSKVCGGLLAPSAPTYSSSARGSFGVGMGCQ